MEKAGMFLKEEKLKDPSLIDFLSKL